MIPTKTTDIPTTTTSIEELKKLADIYTSMTEPNKSIFVMSGSLLLASQNAAQQPRPQKTG